MKGRFNLFIATAIIFSIGFLSLGCGRHDKVPNDITVSSPAPPSPSPPSANAGSKWDQMAWNNGTWK